MTSLARLSGRRILATTAVVALGAFGALVTSTAAHAAAIDPTETGSITIHKYANPGNGAANPDGTGTQPNTDPIAGVTFEVRAIEGINLTDGTNTGWDALNAITLAQKEALAHVKGQALVYTLADYDLVDCNMYTTGEDGVVTTSSLPVGPYFVRETGAPSAVVAPVVPFIVTVPTPAVNAGIENAPLDGEWVYDVNVYPKNTIAEAPRKNISTQAGAALGSQTTFQISAKVPALAKDETYNKLVFTDTLDTRLTPNTDLSVISVTSFAGDVTFTQGTDYTAAWAGQKLTVTFTDTGLGKLAAGQQIILSFQATANTVGTIENIAYVNINDFVVDSEEVGEPGEPGEPGDGSPTNKVETRWGTLTAKKVNVVDTTQGLAGAQFEIYMGATETAGCVADIDTLAVVTTPGTTTPLVLTSDAAGTIAINGLWVGDTALEVAADGTVTNTTVAGRDFASRCYVLKEIAAPAGFVLPTGAAALTEVVINTGDNGTIPLVEIDNTQQGVPTLPFTGADGQQALTIAGIALAVIALGGVFIVRRRKAQADA